MNSNKVPQQRISGLAESIENLTASVLGKANVKDLSRVPVGLTHSIKDKSLVVAPGHVLNNSCDQVFILEKEFVQPIDTVTQALRDKLILGETGERVDIIDYSTLVGENTTAGIIVPVDSLIQSATFIDSGSLNSKGAGFDDAVAMFYEGTATSKNSGFIFNHSLPLGEYVVTLASDEPISSALIAFYRIKNKSVLEDGTTDFEVELVSKSVATATPNVKVSLSALAPESFDIIAVSVGTSFARYCRMYKVEVAATYNTFLCRHSQEFVLKLSLSESYLLDAGYANFAKIGQVTIGNGPVFCYPEKDIASAYADGDLKQQEPSYSSFYTRGEVDDLLETKATKTNTLAGYGITNAYTKNQVDMLIASGSSAGLEAGTNIEITTDPESGKLVISTAFAEVYSKEETDTKFAAKTNTLAGYGITDAYTKAESTDLLNAKQNANDPDLTTDAKDIGGAINELDATKADASTTLAGYGISDAYTKAEVDKLMDEVSGGAGGTVDNVTIIKDDASALTAVGIKTKSNIIKYDWIGTKAEWEEATAKGDIDPTWICYITDDGIPVASTLDEHNYASIEYVHTYVASNTNPTQSELEEHKASSAARLDAIDSTMSDLELRLSTLEDAFSAALDEINGEVI